MVLYRNIDEAKTALSKIQSWIADNGLELSPEKTHIGSSLQPGHGFEFLRKPPTGEPCAGEPHARFGGWGGVTLPAPLSSSGSSGSRIVDTLYNMLYLQEY
ncbi:MAG: hypothetical protein HGJ94_08425 [Desulfosarcina sp.]|nr:hypothetical protein [Desulfosarcina sp.]MBC2743875.1 hypothetical protein [Desulfosarcina sp.]MBC2766784.1 hypothetical protein [Desulfosarcina sp.]